MRRRHAQNVKTVTRLGSGLSSGREDHRAVLFKGLLRSRESLWPHPFYRASLQVGEEVIAFLKKRDEAGTFSLPYGGYSVLRVQGDKVAPSSKRIADTRPLDSSNLAEVERTIRDLAAAPKQ